MVDLPSNGDGLTWILNQGPARLLLIPGLQPASIAAAALGDQQAQAYLRFKAQEFASFPMRPGGIGIENSPFGSFCHAASQADPQTADTAVSGQAAAARWLRALCDYDLVPMLAVDDGKLMELAAGQGNLDMLMFLHSCPVAWDVQATFAAVSHPLCFRWLVSLGCPIDSDHIVAALAGAGQLDVLKWLRTLNNLPQLEWGPSAMRRAAQKGDLKMLQWLRSLDPPCGWNSSCFAAAAGVGGIGMLQWMLAQGCPWSVSATNAAAMKGQLKALEWLRANGCPWDAKCAAAAMKPLDLEIITWMRAQDPPCPWDATCTQAAARRGSLTKMQWLRANGCPWDASTTAAAAAAMAMPLLEWMFQQEPPCAVDRRGMASAARRGSVEMLELFVSRGCTVFSGLYCDAAEYNRPSVLKWLYRRGISTPPELIFASNITTPNLMLLSDMGNPIHPDLRPKVILAQRQCATLHGLLRWCRRAVSDPSRGLRLAFNFRSSSSSGQYLLVRLSLLPPELMDRICIMAGLQHDLTFACRVDLSSITNTTA